DEDDNNITLVKIRGIDNPIDTDMDPAMLEVEEKARDFINSSNTKAVPVPSREQAEVTTDSGNRFEEIKGEVDVKPGYYLIANVFEKEENYSHFARILSDRGIQPKSFVRKKNQYTYVYLDRYNTREEAERARDSQYDGKYTDDVWIFRVIGK
ncbi:MAG: SPOR domain-containing protein, partial [Flavobacteriaceae bacterium]|nr:SPOR domain-containing protein [Muriicola sp.]NNL39338.1 SPOR domain-containing protein [Flavobacteriaceae bacterium]